MRYPIRPNQNYLIHAYTQVIQYPFFVYFEELIIFF